MTGVPENLEGAGTARHLAPRYAVYFLPEAGTPLAQFGTAWIGYDPVSGKVMPREWFGLDPDFADRLTTALAVYGFHATLKAPFRLRQGCTLGALIASLAGVARHTPSIASLKLQVSRFGQFLALRPEINSSLRHLATRCTLALESFRAPLTNADRERRLRAGLSPHQQVLLETYGYPYVLSEYRFHMSLTGALTDAEYEIAEPALSSALGPVTADAVSISSICLVVQSAPNLPFQLHTRWKLSA